MSIPIGKYFTAFLRDEFGSELMNVDGSTTPVPFSFVVPEGFVLHLHAITVLIRSFTPARADRFGDIAGITNGLKAELINGHDRVMADYFAGTTIKTTSDFGSFVGTQMGEAGGVRGQVIQWTSSAVTGGQPLEIMYGRTIRWTVQDDLTPLQTFRVALLGVYLGEAENPTEFMNPVHLQP